MELTGCKVVGKVDSCHGGQVFCHNKCPVQNAVGGMSVASRSGCKVRLVLIPFRNVGFDFSRQVLHLVGFGSVQLYKHGFAQFRDFSHQQFLEDSEFHLCRHCSLIGGRGSSKIYTYEHRSNVVNLSQV